MKCIRIPFKACSDRAQPIDLVVEVISTAAAVAAIAELTVGKTVTIPAHSAHTIIIIIILVRPKYCHYWIHKGEEIVVGYVSQV